MSFSFSASGHAGTNVEPNDDDEGNRVKAFISDMLDSARENGLNLTVHSVSPERWAPETVSVTDASA